MIDNLHFIQTCPDLVEGTDPEGAKGILSPIIQSV